MAFDVGPKELYLTNVMGSDGREFVATFDPSMPLRPMDQPSNDAPSQNIFKVWGFGELYHPRGEFILTAAAEAARAKWDPYTDTLALRCLAPGMPNGILNPYPIELIAEGDQYRLRIEKWDAVRIIHMSTRPIPAGTLRPPLGYSIGRWEGRALVVETSRVDFPYLDDEGTPMSADVQMVEHFTINENGDTLPYDLTVTDPEYLVEPVVWESSWKWVPGEQLKPFECKLD